VAKSVRKQLRTLNKQLKKAITLDLAKPSQMRFLGTEAIKLIVKRTRNGFGVEADGQPSRRLMRLTENYVNYRKQNRFRLSPFTTPGKSNLTFTGQMLDSFQIRQVSQGRTFIAPFGRRKGGGPTNLQVAGYVTENGRPFNNLSRSEIQRLAKLLIERFPRIARSNRLRVR
jgi:hypothetical protein